MPNAAKLTPRAQDLVRRGVAPHMRNTVRCEARKIHRARCAAGAVTMADIKAAVWELIWRERWEQWGKRAALGKEVYL